MKPRPLLALIVVSAITIFVCGAVIYDDFDTSQGWLSELWYGNAPPAHEYHPIRDILFVLVAAGIIFAVWSKPDLLLEKRTHVLTFNKTVVTYRYPEGTTFIDSLFANPTKQIQIILDEYPGADLKKHEAALGVKIVNVQRHNSNQPNNPSEPDDDVPLGTY